MRWGLRGVLVCNFTHHLWDLWDGVSEQYLCATSHIIYEMGSQGGTCVQLHTSSVRSMRWGIRGVLVCNFTHYLWDGVSGGYFCATSHIIYEMGSQRGTCVQLHTSSMRWGLRGVLVCNFTHRLWDGVSGGTCVQFHTSSMRWGLRGVLVCNFTHHLLDLQDGVSGGTCVQLHTLSMRWGLRGVLVCNFTHHLWYGVSEGYLCATSHIICEIYEMGSQRGTCVQLHTSSVRWCVLSNNPNSTQSDELLFCLFCLICVCWRIS